MSDMRQRSFKKYDASFKLGVVSTLRGGTESVDSISARIGVHAHTLYRWIKEAESGKLDKSQVGAVAPAAALPVAPAAVSLAGQADSRLGELEWLRARVLALETMIELAESELGIAIKKKSFAKPSICTAGATRPLADPSALSGCADGLALADRATTSELPPRSASKAETKC